MLRFLPLATVITGSILVQLCLGSFYIFGNISPYIISYLRNRTDDHTLRNVDNIWIMNAATVLAPVAMSCGGILDRRLGVRLTCTIGCMLFCAGVSLTYFTIKRSLVYVSLTYGLLTNFGASLSYGPPAQNAAKWLPSRPTFAVGMIVCGYGGGAIIFNQVVTAYINPDNLSPSLETPDGEKYFIDKDLLDRVPDVFLLLGGIYAIMCFIGTTLILPASPGSQTCLSCCYSYRSDISLLNDEEKAALSTKRGRSTLKEILPSIVRNKNAWLWTIILFMVYGGMQFANSFYKAYGQTFIADDHFLALVGSISSIFNCLCRPMWGALMDKYGFQVAIKVLCTLFVCLSTTLLLTEKMNKVFFLLWICGLYASSCGLWAIGPSLLGKLFGMDNMAICLGFQFIAVMVGTIAGGFIGLSLQGVIGWHGLFLTAGCMGTAAFFISFFFDGKDTEGKAI